MADGFENVAEPITWEGSEGTLLKQPSQTVSDFVGEIGKLATEATKDDTSKHDRVSLINSLVSSNRTLYQKMLAILEVLENEIEIGRYPSLMAEFCYECLCAIYRLDLNLDFIATHIDRLRSDKFPRNQLLENFWELYDYLHSSDSEKPQINQILKAMAKTLRIDSEINTWHQLMALEVLNKLINEVPEVRTDKVVNFLCTIKSKFEALSKTKSKFKDKSKVADLADLNLTLLEAYKIYPSQPSINQN